MPPILPDVLRPGLAVVFCGTAAGAASARAGAYYAGPGNGFWRTLHEIGLTPELLAPAQFERLPEFGVGLTDVCKVRSGSDAEVGRDRFDLAGLRRRIAVAAPTHLAFNGKNAARAALGRAVAYGRQPEPFGAATAWVLPSTSGAARGFWDPEPWRQLGGEALESLAARRAAAQSVARLSPGQVPVAPAKARRAP
jgi:TDG/mug DNA glycosylase family protein